MAHRVLVTLLLVALAAYALVYFGVVSGPFR